MEIFINGLKPDAPYGNWYVGNKNLTLGKLEFNGTQVYEVRFDKNPWDSNGDLERFNQPKEVKIEYGGFKAIVNNMMVYQKTAHLHLRTRGTGGV